MAKVAAPSCARVRREGGPSTAMRVSSRLLLIAAIALLTGCGSNGGGGNPQTPRTTGAVAPTPCIANSPAAHRTVGTAQALTTIPIQVLTGVPASSGVMDVGSASCIDVGVSQRVAVTVHARIPPLPAEPSAFPRLLSAILVSPAVQPGAGTAQAATYTLTFTAIRGIDVDQLPGRGLPPSARGVLTGRRPMSAAWVLMRSTLRACLGSRPRSAGGPAG